MKTLTYVFTITMLGMAEASSAMAQVFGGGPGRGAPAPEIGAGLIGVALAIGAVKYFRRRQRG